VSRIGKQPVKIPEGVKVTIKKDSITVKGKKEELSINYDPTFTITEKDKEVIVERPDDSKNCRALHGLFRVQIANMMVGVTKGFEKILEIQGVGFSAEMKSHSLFMNLGFSHPVMITPPDDIRLEIIKNLTIKVSGSDKQKVGQIAAKIRDVYPPEPYKGKGIRYQGEYVRRKAGKKVGVE